MLGVQVLDEESQVANFIIRYRPKWSRADSE